jgi:hypothetical protein
LGHQLQPSNFAFFDPRPVASSALRQLLTQLYEMMLNEMHVLAFPAMHTTVEQMMQLHGPDTSFRGHVSEATVRSLGWHPRPIAAEPFY